jgi:hypothetical protein
MVFLFPKISFFFLSGFLSGQVEQADQEQEGRGYDRAEGAPDSSEGVGVRHRGEDGLLHDDDADPDGGVAQGKEGASSAVNAGCQCRNRPVWLMVNPVKTRSRTAGSACW